MSGLKFRLKAFGLHIGASACALLLVLSVLYLGWYRWPGWYLTGVSKVAGMLVGVDVVLGPLLTLIVANPNKPRRGLARDIAVIVAVQVAALVYGTATLWHGRPLYYAFSENELQLVQASDLDPAEIALAQKLNPEFAPHWYSLPRWIWAPLPQDEKLREQIMRAAITGGNDVVQMPRYFKAWDEGKADLRKRLKAVASFGEFGSRDKQILRKRMLEAGYRADDAATLPMMGRGKPLLAVFDPRSLQVQALIRAD